VNATPTRRDLRLLLGVAAVLTPAQAAELLPWRDADAREWLDRAKLVRRVDGREVVIWGDVILALRGEEKANKPPAPEPPTRRRRGVGLPRVRLS